MSKLKAVLEKRIAVLNARLIESINVLAEADAEIKRRNAEIDSVATGRAADIEALKERLGLRDSTDIRRKRLEVGAEVEAKYGDQLAQAELLKKEKALLEQALPFVGMFEGALAEYLPLTKEVVAELEPQLVDVFEVVFGDLVMQTALDLWERGQSKLGKRSAGLWAKGCKIKLDALVSAGFSKAEAMQLLLANSENPAAAMIKALKNTSSQARKSSK
ncbi:hypothetical protein A2482_04190 [Candidatus Falkowbacteria bacterium RIFOXYC2_FULL_48_21]|uniref:Uncharacterized protein n=1 Tax=Candidatus Falkowbacteria bacterium RIFOXYC2_FULL_48_21 TaxID=1798005 RepID=A0A1F5TCH7_9BACT|nr:MAG: hypothetical protein A2482_04190 [Candidatus Falkowbacteria bacterium RIFOXYC2_FULL_48_21]